MFCRTITGRRRQPSSARHITFAVSAVAFLAGCALGADLQIPDGANMSWLSNAEVTVGVDLNRGGAIVYLARNGSGNMINNHDLGRQCQLSFYSGPVPFESNGKKPGKYWAGLGWNPIQSGDDYGHRGRVLKQVNDGKALYVKSVPMQWPLDNVPGECTFESWLHLEGNSVAVRARLNNARADRTQYSARNQELPALYLNAPFHHVVSYFGDHPFTGGTVGEPPKPLPGHPWSEWMGTEGWSALLNDHNHGVGLITYGRISFCGGFVGVPGTNDTRGNSTAYVASCGLEVLDHNIAYEYRYELVPGSLEEIRSRAAALRPGGPPEWTFNTNRAGWSYVNAGDSGWPVKDALDVQLDRPDPQVTGPYCFWRAEDAPYMIFTAAFKTTEHTATIYWQPWGGGFDQPDSVDFPVQSDGEFHEYIVKLAGAPAYHGGMIRLRLDPEPNGAPGDRVRIRSVRLSGRPAS